MSTRHRRAVLALLFAAAQVSFSCQGKDAGRSPRGDVDLGEAVRSAVSRALSEIPAPVTIRLYRGRKAEVGSDEAESLLALMIKASGKVSGAIHDITELPSRPGLLVPKHGPVFVVEGPKAMAVRYLGYPADLELSPFLDGLLTAAGKEAALSERTRGFLDGLREPVSLRVFVSPS